ncbi:hypothetical protein CIRG_07479 [Coccidioides immitis RMSCC 2394]|uniref:Uncharacterized protein n=1 Tax=Coccidioides immitis RMSCC 2394 TaxID=404692 RepID=A0A0J6YLI7_COCIT|nr:hypothetical protein CIRG_07479 [Coccidioides immitis RMSCC 2394]
MEETRSDCREFLGSPLVSLQPASPSWRHKQLPSTARDDSTLRPLRQAGNHVNVFCPVCSAAWSCPAPARRNIDSLERHPRIILNKLAHLPPGFHGCSPPEIMFICSLPSARSRQLVLPWAESGRTELPWDKLGALRVRC